MKKGLKKAQIQSQIFVYLLVAVIIGFMLLFAFKAISGFGKKNIEHQIILFQENIKKDIEAQAIHIGSVVEESYTMPNFVTRVCFMDVSKREEILSAGSFEDFPLIVDSLETTDNNMFLFDEDDNFYNSFNVGNVNLLGDYNCKPHVCFDVQNKVLNVLMMGRGHATLLLPIAVNKQYLVTCDCPKGCRIRPIAQLLAEEGMQYMPVFFNASGSHDIDDEIAQYFWNFGDGNNKTTESSTTEHIYSDINEYEVELVVTDVDGLEGKTTTSVEITPYQLIANAGGDRTEMVGNDVAFDGSNSMGRIISWHWEFGDIRDKEDEGEIVHFTYIQHGSKVATLTVTDVFDNTAIDTINVEVTPR